MTLESHARTAAACLGVRLEAVIARHLHHLASRAGGRHPEPIALALDDEHWHRHRIELGEAALRWLGGAARRLEGEREAEHHRSGTQAA